MKKYIPEHESAENFEEEREMEGMNQKPPTPTKDVHGVQLTDIQIMVFNKWCDTQGISMNTLQPEHRKEVVGMWLKNTGQSVAQPTPTKEGLHTQGANFETLHIGLATDDEDCQLINELGEEILIIKSYPLKENAEKIMRSVNERQALLDSNRELLETLKELHGYAKQFKAYNTIHNSTHFTVANMIANGLHNKFK